VKESRQLTALNQQHVGNDPVEMYQKVYGPTKYARSRAYILLKQERVLNYVDKSSRDVAKQLGLDHEWILSRMMQLADASLDEKVRATMLKELAEIIGTKQRQRITMGMMGSVFGGFTEDDLNEIEEAEEKNLIGSGD